MKIKADIKRNKLSKKPSPGQKTLNEFFGFVAKSEIKNINKKNNLKEQISEVSEKTQETIFHALNSELVSKIQALEKEFEEL